MKGSLQASEWDRSDELVVEIVEILEEHGLSQNDFQLNDFIDVDALSQVVLSGGDTAVTFSVEGVHLTVTSDSVLATAEEEQRWHQGLDFSNRDSNSRQPNESR